MMKFLLPFAAYAATVYASPLTSRDPENFARVVISHLNQIFLFTYDSVEFQQLLNLTVDGVPSWLGLVQKDRLYSVDAYSATTSEFNLDLPTTFLETIGTAQGRLGGTHLEFNQNATRMVSTAWDEADVATAPSPPGAVDIWDISDGFLTHLKTIDNDDHLEYYPDYYFGRPSQSVLDPTGRFFVVNNIASDNIVILDSKNDSFDIAGNKSVAAGCGPSRGAFYPPGNSTAKATHYLVTCETSNAIKVFSLAYTTKTIDFTLLQTISSWGEDASTRNATAGEIIIVGSDDVYVSNRATDEPTDNIAHFKFSDDSKLSFESRTSVGGSQTYTFSVLDDSKDLLIANQVGPLVVTVLRRGDNGVLNETPVTSIDESYFGPYGVGARFIKQVGRGQVFPTK